MFGLQTVPASRASLIIALESRRDVASAVPCSCASRCRVTASSALHSRLLGVAVELSGGNPMNLFARRISLLGEAGDVRCVLSWAAYTLLGKRMLGEGVSLARGDDLCGAGRHADAGRDHMPARRIWIFRRCRPKPGGRIAFIGHASAPRSPIVWFYDGVRTIGPARTAVFINLVPVVAIALGCAAAGREIACRRW